MVKAGVRSILLAILTLALTLSQTGLAQAKLTEKEKVLMKEGRVKELAASLTKGAKGRVEKVSRLYSFVRDEIKVFQFKERRASCRLLMDGAGREEDKAKLLFDLLYDVKVKSYLATINFVKYGEDRIFSFVALKATKKEAEALSRATGGGGRFTRFPLKKGKGRFIPLVPLAGYSPGQVSTEFYEEVEEGSGKWKKWKYYVSFAPF